MKPNTASKFLTLSQAGRCGAGEGGGAGRVGSVLCLVTPAVGLRDVSKRHVHP